MRVDTSGNVLVGVASANANGGILQLSKGITFPATDVPSTDANTLDDYEEGTFTPTIAGTTTAGTGTYATNGQVGRYTKIGNVVHFRIFLSWTNLTGTGNLVVNGLPFTSNSTTNNTPPVACRISNLTLTAANVFQAFVGASSTSVTLEQAPTAGGAAAGVPVDNTAQIALAGTYEI